MLTTIVDMQAAPNDDDIPPFLSGDGEMAQRIREFDWASSPLGPARSWSPSLKVSIPEFLGRLGTEAQCAAALIAARWPLGFRCPRCACAEHYVVGHGARKLFQCNKCNGCRHQTSVTAGSLMEHTKWVNTVLGNLKTTLAGAFAYRFNRRFDLRDLIARLVVDVARGKPAREAVVRAHAEAAF
ncbi:MAG: IS1595 family transposase [Rubrivivax sp.]